MPSFPESLAAGKISEQLVLEVIRKYYPAFPIEGYCKLADIVFYRNGRWEGAEVKQDFRSDETGNWCIELDYGGKKSAIMTTGSAYWILVDRTTLHFITPLEILRCIAYEQPQRKVFVGPGDHLEKTTHLIKKHVLAPYVSFTVPIN